MAFEAAPHKAVRISIEAVPHNHLVEVLSGPRQLPRQRSFGCPRNPVLPNWHQGAAGHTGLAECSRKWPALIHAVDAELCRLNDIVELDGSAKRTFFD